MKRGLGVLLTIGMIFACALLGYPVFLHLFLSIDLLISPDPEHPSAFFGLMFSVAPILGVVVGGIVGYMIASRIKKKLK